MILSGDVVGTIYGTVLAAEAYIGSRLGDQYAAWLALGENDRNRALVSAASFLDAQEWVADFDTFAERDASTAFVNASYELAALVAADPDVVAVADQGNNIQSLGAGGATISYFNPTSTRGGTAPRLPPILMRLIGKHLSSANVSIGIGAPSGQSGSSSNPFAACSDYDRSEP